MQKVLTSLILAMVFLVPAYGINIGISTNGVSTSENLDLDGSTAYKSTVLIDDGTIFQERNANGNNYNRITDNINGDNYAITSNTFGSGSFSSSESTISSADSALANQNNAIFGDAGYTDSEINSKENDLFNAMGFIGKGGSINSASTYAASDVALAQGNAQINGIEYINNDVNNVLSSGDIGRSVEGIYETGDNRVGNFALLSYNRPTSIKPVDYKLAGYKCNSAIQLYLRTDTIPSVTGSGSTADIVKAIDVSAETWDAATNAKLYNGIAQTTSYPLDYYDNKFVHGWKALTTKDRFGRTIPNLKTIAYTDTWYSLGKMGGYYPVLDSDIVYNNYFTWSLDGTNTDLQTIATHELGHTFGLLDLYDSKQSQQIMYGYYTQGTKKYVLGSGDKAGIQKIYGA